MRDRPDDRATLLRRRRPDSPSPPHRARGEFLGLMAEGRSNSASPGTLLSERTVEANIATMFRKLDVPVSPDVNRRVLAVLTLLRA